MQFALLIYESPEAFAARKNDGTIPTSVPGGRTTRLSSKPASTLAAIRLKCRRPEPQCG